MERKFLTPYTTNPAGLDDATEVLAPDGDVLMTWPFKTNAEQAARFLNIGFNAGIWYAENMQAAKNDAVANETAVPDAH